jgi:hypothetical protein
MTMAGTVSPLGVRYLPDGRRTFEAGHTAAVKHGAFSPRLVGPIAEEIVGELAEMVKGTPAEGPSFLAARSALALKLARLRRVIGFIETRHGGLPFDDEGQVLPAARLELELLASIEKSLAALGLTPASAATLGVDLLRGSSLAADLQAALDARDRADKRMAATPDAEHPS